MRLKLLIISLLASILLNSELKAQTASVFAIGITAGPEFHMISVDPADGTCTTLGTVNEIGGTSMSRTAGDKSNNYYAFFSDDSWNDRLFNISEETGTILNSPILTNSVGEPQCDCNSDSIYGVYWTGTEEYFASMNKVTGNRTSYCEIPGLKWISGGRSTFDQTNQRYIILASDDLGDNYIYEVDVQSSSMFSTTYISSSPSELQWSQINDSLYCLTWDGSHPHITTINRQSGALTDIMTIDSAYGLQSGISTFDQNLGHYIFLSNDKDWNQRILEVDPVSGTLVNCSYPDIYLTEIVTGACLASTLPVKFANIQAKPTSDNKITIEWVTASESNNEYFEVQRLSSYGTFQTIGRVEGAGNSVEPLSYSFIDEAPYEGINYYKIKQYDYNGKYSLTKTVFAEVKDDDNILTTSVYDNILQIQGYNTNNEIFIKLYDITGRTLPFNIIEKTDSIIKISLPENIYGVFLLELISDRNLIYKEKIFLNN